jgi:hypothetical protein
MLTEEEEEKRKMGLISKHSVLKAQPPLPAGALDGAVRRRKRRSAVSRLATSHPSECAPPTEDLAPFASVKEEISALHRRLLMMELEPEKSADIKTGEDPADPEITLADDGAATPSQDAEVHSARIDKLELGLASLAAIVGKNDKSRQAGEELETILSNLLSVSAQLSARMDEAEALIATQCKRIDDLQSELEVHLPNSSDHRLKGSSSSSVEVVDQWTRALDAVERLIVPEAGYAPVAEGDTTEVPDVESEPEPQPEPAPLPHPSANLSASPFMNLCRAGTRSKMESVMFFAPTATVGVAPPDHSSKQQTTPIGEWVFSSR